MRALNQHYTATITSRSVQSTRRDRDWAVDRTAATVLMGSALSTAPVPDLARTVIAGATPEHRGVESARSARPAIILSALVSLFFWIWMVARIATQPILP